MDVSNIGCSSILPSFRLDSEAGQNREICNRALYLSISSEYDDEEYTLGNDSGCQLRCLYGLPYS